MTTWITDDNGNRASVECWGSEEAARASLATLKNCRDCDNCTRCTYCTDCTRCTYCTRCTRCTDCTRCTYCRYCTRCTYCTDCTRCTYCTRCTRCDLTNNPHHRLPVSDPRGYTWLAIHDGTQWRVYAGCRVGWTLQQARDQWLSDGYDGPQSVRETVGFALDWIEGKDPGQP